MGEFESSSSGKLPDPAPAAGVLTFLIADVRGYTRFTQERGDEEGARLAVRFAEVARAVATAHDGRVIELRGDEALAVFKSARQALRAALDLQARLAAETRDDASLPLKAGVGIDAGEAIPFEEGYRGGALNLAARLCALADPGEVLLTEDVAHLARRIEGLTYLDRGEALVKGLTEPVKVIQVVPESDVPQHVPRFSVHGGSGLPMQPTSFVGRSDQVAEVVTLLKRQDVRLLTLTGPGGAGKTRMALRVADAVLDDFAGGVFFQPLDSIDDPRLVAPTIAMTLSVKESSGRDGTDALVARLQERATLLVLDNFEHLLGAVPLLGKLLAACPGLKLLVTSRSVLRLSGEHRYEVTGMRLPDLAQLPEPARLEKNEAVRLFLLRAQAVLPDFRLTRDNARAIAEICVHLDGLPLAIELCAARTPIFPPDALLTRLTGRQESGRLATLTRGPVDMPARHQTLRYAISWSYDLLTPEEQRLFAALSVFSGGWTLEAAEQTCGSNGGGDVPEGLMSLAEKSLIRQDARAGEPRFTLLETIREYSLDRLRAAGQEQDAKRRHAEYFQKLAERLSRPGSGAEQFRVRMETLEREHNNLRAALSWCIQESVPDLAFRMIDNLWQFWWVQGYFSEGARWADEALALEGGDEIQRAGALAASGILSWARGQLARAHEQLTAALAVYERERDLEGTALVVSSLGLVAAHQRRFEEAARLNERYLAIARALGEKNQIATAMGNLADALWLLGDRNRAEQLFEESLALWRETGGATGILHQLTPLSLLALERGDVQHAAELQLEALTLSRELGNRESLAFSLEAAGRLAAATGTRPRDAAVLWGAAEAVREALSQPPEPIPPGVNERYLAAVRSALGDAEFARCLSAGRSLAPEQAQDRAIEMLSRSVAEIPSRR
jgi:predicted ATPase/class 3 adenylate cyclase